MLLCRRILTLLFVFFPVSSLSTSLGPLNIALREAIKIEDVASVSELLALGADAEITLSEGMNSIMLASLGGGGAESVLAVLLASVPEGEARGRLGESGLLTAISKGQAAVLTLLLDAGASPDAANRGGSTPLMLAAYKGDTSIVALLLSRGARVSIIDEDGMSALMYAALYGHSGAIKQLLSAGADAVGGRRKGSKTTALQMAASAACGECVAALLAAKAKVDVREATHRRTALHFAASIGAIDVVETLLLAGARPELKDTEGATPLIYAAAGGYAHVTRALLRDTGDTDTRTTRDLKGYTPLLHAVFAGHADVVSLLLGGGGDKKDSGVELVIHNTLLSPLHAAVIAGHVEIVKLLLSAGAHVEAVTAADETPLRLAAFSGNVAIIHALLAAGALIDLPSIQSGRTALHIAASGGKEHAVYALLRADANTELQDGDGVTAIDHSSTSVVKACFHDILPPSTPYVITLHAEVMDKRLSKAVGPRRLRDEL